MGSKYEEITDGTTILHRQNCINTFLILSDAHQRHLTGKLFRPIDIIIEIDSALKWLFNNNTIIPLKNLSISYLHDCLLMIEDNLHYVLMTTSQPTSLLAVSFMDFQLIHDRIGVLLDMMEDKEIWKNKYKNIMLMFVHLEVMMGFANSDYAKLDNDVSNSDMPILAFLPFE